MISVVVLAPDGVGDEAARIVVARSLGWLVSAVVAGVVADVVLAAPASLAVADVAESAGCALVEAGGETERLRLAVARCRRAQLLVVRAGYIPRGPLVDELEERLRSGLVAPAALLVAPLNLVQRLRPARTRIIGVLAEAERWQRADFRTLTGACRRRDRFATDARRIG